MKPQTAAVLALLRTTGRLGITPNMARERVGTDRLAARIAELRADGHNIETTRVTVRGKTFARYILTAPLTLDALLDGGPVLPARDRRPAGRRSASAGVVPG